MTGNLLSGSVQQQRGYRQASVDSVLPPVRVTGSDATSKIIPKKPGQRGGNTRVGRVISDTRIGRTEEAWTPGSSLGAALPPGSRLVEEEERRVQHEIIDMLTAKLAKKEKETELCRRQHEALESERQTVQSQLDQLVTTHERAQSELRAQLKQMGCEFRQAKHEAEQFKQEAEMLRVQVYEARRQRERDVTHTRAREESLQEELAACRRELTLAETQCRSMEHKWQAEMSAREDLMTRSSQADTTVSELDKALEESRRCTADLLLQLDEARQKLQREEDARRKLEQAKLHLEEKTQQMTRTIRDTTTRASEAERRKSDLSQAESQLSRQLTQLHREQEELRARSGQLTAQVKQLQSKITQLENTKAVSEAKLKEAGDEVEQSRKKCREYQFRIRQLQEEVVFQTKRKINTTPGSSDQAPATTSQSIAQPAATQRAEEPETDHVPTWMRD